MSGYRHLLAAAERGQRGTSTVGMVIVVPVLMALALLVVGLGRTVAAHDQVVSAARSAARAASLATSPAEAAAAARAAAGAALAGQCQDTQIDPQVSAFAAGGAVTVSVTCTVSLSDVALSGLPGHTTWSATATAPIESYRQLSTAGGN